jgi:hypothetical protein
MNSTGRTGSHAAEAAIVLAPNAAAAVNAVNKAERYIALSRLILLSPVFAGVTIHPIYFYALFSQLSPKDCRARSRIESRKRIVRKPDVCGIRVFGIIGEAATKSLARVSDDASKRQRCC